jgi:hypothetical protein
METMIFVRCNPSKHHLRTGSVPGEHGLRPFGVYGPCDPPHARFRAFRAMRVRVGQDGMGPELTPHATSPAGACSSGACFAMLRADLRKIM